MDVHDATTATDRAVETRRTNAASEGAAVRRGEVLGRFVVLGPRGAGAMGAVYEAYDPELDRKVALKLLHPRVGAVLARIIGEARALARLSHANVVTVFDVGRVHLAGAGEERLFIAMELVDGVDLRCWLAERRRSWAEVRRVFVAAGRGLAAAHEAALVHRDFKPANVLVGRAGEVKIVDFGLASLGHAPSTTQSDPLSLAVDTQLSGTVMGTPRYMAPELHAGQVADARADVYAFCVALHEAVYGTPPFAGADEASLVAAKLRPLGRPPTGGLGPPGLHRLLARGLAPDPAERHPSMAALLGELDNEPRRRRTLALTLVGAGGLAALAAGLWPAAPAAEELARAQVDEVWSMAARQQLEEVLGDRDRATVERTLDAYADAWVGAHVAARRASDRGEHQAALLELRLACLRRRLDGLRAQLVVLAEADAAAVARAVDAVARLPPVDRCADLEALLSQVEPPTDPAVAAAVEALQRRLLEVDALERAGLYRESLEKATLAHADALAIPYPPVHAAALLRLGVLSERAGDFPAAEAALLAAAELAESLGDDETATLAAAEALYVLGYRQQRHAEALVWAHHARALALRPGGAPEHRALILDYLGVVHEAAGRYDEAEAAYREAMALHTAERGEEHPLTAMTRSSLANLHHRRGAYAEALAGHRQAFSVLERWHGPEHPEATTALMGVGIDLVATGEFDAAQETLERVLTLRERPFGRDHAGTAVVHNNLGILHLRRRDWSRAWTHFERALEIWRRELGEGHPNVTLVLSNLAMIRHRQGAYRDAVDRFRQLLALADGELDSSHAQRLTPLSNLGGALRKLGRCDEAAEVLGEARALVEARADVPPLKVAAVLGNLAWTQRCRGRLAEAVESGNSALARLEATGPSSQRTSLAASVRILLAEVALERGDRHTAAEQLGHAAEEELGETVDLKSRYQFTRARWLRAEGARAEARALAVAARAELARVEPEGSYDLECIDRWLAEEPGTEPPSISPAARPRGRGRG